MKSGVVVLIGILFGAFIGIVAYRNVTSTKSVVSSDVVIERIKSVKKLVVTEGMFSEVYSYKEEDELYEYFGLNKKALLIVKGRAQVSYDLELIDYQVDESTKTIKIINVPAPEISIDPQITYYDLQEFMLNSFSTEERNSMNAMAIEKLRQEVNKSELKNIARKELETALNDLQIVGKELGWKVVWPQT